MSPEDHPEIKLTDITRALKTADDIEMPTDSQYFDQLHDKIMAQVAETEIKSVPPWQAVINRPKTYVKTHWKLWVATGFSISTAGFLSFHISAHVSSWIPESHTFKVVQNEKEFLQKALGSVETFSGTM